MSRRVALPGADELFRTTGTGPEAVESAGSANASRPMAVVPASGAADGAATGPAAAPAASVPARTSAASVRQTTRPRALHGDDRRPSGRERHDEKITVYLSPEELIDLERARLTLRQDHGMAVDRGRIVREAIALVLAELDAKGEHSALVKRLRGA